MAIAAATGDLWQVVLKGEQENQEVLNVLSFRSNAADLDVEVHLIQIILQCYVDNMLPGQSAAYHLSEARWKKVSPVLGPEFVTITGGTSSGDKGGDALPSFCSGLVSIRTALGGRSHRGRMFIPGIPETDTTKSFLNVEGVGINDYWNALVAYLNCIFQAFIRPPAQGGSNFTLGVYSRKNGGAVFPYNAAGFTAATELIPNRLIATTRSRKVGRGS